MSDQVLDEYQAALLAAQNPDYFLPEQFCADGVNLIDYIIPPTTSADPKVASLSTGAPPLQQIKPIEGGAAFSRKEYNGILRVLSNMLSFLNKGREFTFNADNLVGYDAGAVLFDYATNRYVVSLHNTNTANFVTNPTLINGADWKFITVTPEVLSSLLAAKANLSGAAFTGAVSVLGVATQGQGIIASGSNANGWWRKYADGWIQQGGLVTSMPGGGGQTITYPITFINGPKSVTAQLPGAGQSSAQVQSLAIDISGRLDTFVIYNWSVGTSLQTQYMAEGS